MTARAPLTAIPDDFGVGGSHLVPGGSSGDPNLRDVLREHYTAIKDLQGETGDDFSVARFATTANLNLATTGLTAIDGVTPVAGDKALVKNQSTASQNGLYVVSAGAWARFADDAGSTTLAEGMAVSVAEGSTNGSKLFVLGSDLTTWTPGTTASLSSATPASLGVAATAGTDALASRDDHVHPWAQKLTVSLTAAITGSADTNGTPNTPINVGAALPARAIVLALEVKVNTQGSGGGVTTAKLDVGYAGDTTALLKQLDLVAAAAGSYDQNAGGSAADKTYPVQAGGKQLTAIVTPDAGHQLSALTALAVDINVYYAVPF